MGFLKEQIIKLLKNNSGNTARSNGIPLVKVEPNTSLLYNNKKDISDSDLDYQRLVTILLKKTNEKQINEVIEFFRNEQPGIHKALLLEFDQRKDNLERNAIDTKIFKDFIQMFNEAKLSLNIGDQLAFLVGKYTSIIERDKDYLSGLYFFLKKWIATEISRKLLELETIIEAKKAIPLNNAFHLFFLYKKDIAERLFRKILSDDKYNNRCNDNETLHYYILKDAIFDRVNLNYLPKIEVIPNAPESIQLSSQESSISKEDLLKIIDNEDNFNVNLPLANLDSGSLINSHQDIENYNELIKLLNALFRTQIQNSKFERKEYYLSFEVGEVFVNNICGKFGNHPKQMFIEIRELIKELLVSDEFFKLQFFRLLYELKEWRFLMKWNTKFPPLMNSYLGNIKGFSKATLKDFFRNNEKNPVFNSDFDVIEFIKKNSNISL